MGSHKEYCESLGNKTYTSSDREIREAIRQGLRNYEQELKDDNDRAKNAAVAFTKYRRDLNALKKMQRDNLGR